MNQDNLLVGDDVIYNGDTDLWEVYFCGNKKTQIPIYARAKMQGRGQPIYKVVLVKVKFYKARNMYCCEYKDL